MQCLQDGERVFVRLDKGSDLFGSLTEVAASLKWRCAHISGIGALKDTELGFLDTTKKDYIRKVFPDDAELLSLDGNLSYLDDKPFWHIHAVLGDRNFQCFGGHLFQATVAVTAEINVRVFDQQVVRADEPSLGINQLQFCKLS